MCFSEKIKDAGYSEYDIAKVKYLFAVLASELSKLLIFTFFWWNQGLFFPFLVCISVFFALRACSGGLHFKHYWACFSFSFFYLILCINWLPRLRLSKLLKLFLLFLCMILACRFSPVVSEYRIIPSEIKRRKSKRNIFIIIFIYFLLLYITPKSQLIDGGFWCIVIHTFQLGVSYFKTERRKKREELEKSID